MRASSESFQRTRGPGAEPFDGPAHVRDAGAPHPAAAADPAPAAADDHVRHAQGLRPAARPAVRGPSGAHPRVPRRARQEHRLPGRPHGVQRPGTCPFHAVFGLVARLVGRVVRSSTTNRLTVTRARP